MTTDSTLQVGDDIELVEIDIELLVVLIRDAGSKDGNSKIDPKTYELFLRNGPNLDRVERIFVEFSQPVPIQAQPEGA